MNEAGRARMALGVTLAIQIYVSIAASASAVLAPLVAPDFGLSPNLVGVFTSLVYMGSTSASLIAGGFINRHGPIRVSQAGVLVCAVGIGLIALAAEVRFGLILLVLAPLIIGVGYGPITPSSSEVLSRTTPSSRLALTFSIKQTGVPAGVALGGAVLPALALAVGWQVALTVIAAIGLVVALVAQPTRSDLDRHRIRDRPVRFKGLFAPLRVVWRDRTLRELSLVALAYAAMQVCLTSYLVVFAVEVLGRSIVSAGFALAVATVGGMIGRVLWGVVADRYAPPHRVMTGVGIAAGLCSLATAAYPAGWPIAPLYVLVVIFGGTAIGWNGVQLAEVARHAPPGQAGAVTGATSFITFSGVVFGPPLFGALAALTGSYRVGFVAMGLIVLGMAIWFGRRARTSR